MLHDTLPSSATAQQKRLDSSISSVFVLPMPEPPYDRALALASQVRTMRDHYLDVSCGCGDRRVIALGVMVRDRSMATATLAHIALKLTCHGCTTGPDEVHLCATIYGREAPTFGGGVVWTLPLVQRPTGGSYHLRHRKQGDAITHGADG